MILSLMKFSRPALCGGALLCLTGCNASRPADREVLNHIEANLPPYLKIVGSEINAVVNPEGKVDFKVSAEVTPKETLYLEAESPALKEVVRRVLLKDDQGEIDTKLTERMLDETHSATRHIKFLKPAAMEGESVALYIRIAAERFGKEWRWPPPQIEQAAIFGARPKSAFPPDSLVLSSPEEAQFLKTLQDKLDALEADELKYEEAKRKAVEKK